MLVHGSAICWEKENKKGNQYKIDEDQQFDNAVCHFPIITEVNKNYTIGVLVKFYPISYELTILMQITKLREETNQRRLKKNKKSGTAVDVGGCKVEMDGKSLSFEVNICISDLINQKYRKAIKWVW